MANSSPYAGEGAFCLLSMISSEAELRVEAEQLVRDHQKLDRYVSQKVAPHISLGWNAVRSTDTPHHGGAPARRADPAASAVWAPQKLDLGRLLGPQVTPGPNGGQICAPLPPLIS